MVAAIRNLGRPGVVSAAIAAVDIALWDLKAKILELPLVELLGRVRDSSVPSTAAVGSRATPTSGSPNNSAAWVHDDRHPPGQDEDRRPTGAPARPTTSASRSGTRRRSAPRPGCSSTPTARTRRKQAVALGRRASRARRDLVRGAGVVGRPRRAAPVRDLTDVDIAAGEYGYDLAYFERMCAAGAVDVLQADVTRCAGITEWLRVAAVAAAHGLEISGHCAPVAARASGLCRPEPASPRVLPRPRPTRTDAVRRRARPRRRRPPSRPSRPGSASNWKTADATRFRIEV